MKSIYSQPGLLACAVAMYLQPCLASAGGESQVGRLLEEKKLTPHLAAVTVYDEYGKGLYLTLELKNETAEAQPGWELTTANSIHATFSRVDREGAEMPLFDGQFNLMGGISMPNARDAPILKVPPGDLVAMGLLVKLDSEHDAVVQGMCGATQPGSYKVVFTTTANHQVLAVCTFQVTGTEAARRAIEQVKIEPQR